MFDFLFVEPKYSFKVASDCIQPLTGAQRDPRAKNLLKRPHLKLVHLPAGSR